MDLRRSSVWNWAVAVVMALQLALAFGHSHRTSDASNPSAAGVAEACPAASAAVLLQSALAAEGPPSCVQASGAPTESAGVRDGFGGNRGHGPDDDDKDCELCWILAALSALIVPLLLALLRLDGPSRRVTVVQPIARRGALTCGAYLARAPPFPIHA